MEKREPAPESVDGDVETTSPKRTVSEQHKRRISEAREQGKAINDMVNLVRAETNGSAAPGTKQRGRPRRVPSLEEIDAMSGDLQKEIADATGVNAAKAAQRLLELGQARTVAERMPDADAVRIAFHKMAGSWSRKHKVSYEAWKLLGIPDADLTAAGINKTA